MPSEKKNSSRLIIFLAFTVLWSGLICTKLFYLQVVRSETYKQEASARQEAVQSLEPQRGNIFDRNMNLLAVSVATESLAVNPQVIKDPLDTLSKICAVLNLNLYEQMKSFNEMKQKGRKFIFIKRKITPQEKSEILRLDIHGLPLCKNKTREYCEKKDHMALHFFNAGIFFEDEYKRYYPNGALASHVLGISNIDEKGLEGVESQYDSYLRGQSLNIQVLKDAAGNEFPVESVAEKKMENHLVLTIDEVIQYIAEKELERACHQTRAYKGCVIVMDPSNGEILALANRPTYNLNNISQYPTCNRKNIAITDLYEPGSTFKIIPLAALVEHDKFNPREIINCEKGSIRVAGVNIGDHHPYHLLNAVEVISKSSNVGVIKLAARLSDEQFYQYIKNFGFGRKTEIDLPGEVNGSGGVRPPSQWSKLSHAVLSIGQEISVTPMQMITSFSAIANRGFMVRPHAAKGYIDPAGIYEPFENEKQKRVLSEKTARILTGILETVVLDGTGKKANVPGYSVTGKTGTAQIFDNSMKMYRKDRFVASFIGYAPSFDPKLLCMVMLELPKGDEYYGGDVAAPVFSKIAGETLSYLQIPPNRETLSAANFQHFSPSNPSKDTASPPFPSRALFVKNQADLSIPHYIEPSRFIQHCETIPIDVEDGLMPDLLGRSLRDALGILSAKGCRAQVSGKGFVTAQCPEAGTALNKGDVCFLALSDNMVKWQEEMKKIKEEKEGS